MNKRQRKKKYKKDKKRFIAKKKLDIVLALLDMMLCTLQDDLSGWIIAYAKYVEAFYRQYPSFKPFKQGGIVPNTGLTGDIVKPCFDK